MVTRCDTDSSEIRLWLWAARSRPTRWLQPHAKHVVASKRWAGLDFRSCHLWLVWQPKERGWRRIFLKLKYQVDHDVENNLRAEGVVPYQSQQQWRSQNDTLTSGTKPLLCISHPSQCIDYRRSIVRLRRLRDRVWGERERIGHVRREEFFDENEIGCENDLSCAHKICIRMQWWSGSPGGWSSRSY